MFTILGADGKEYGPVTAGKLHEWIAGGRANLQTKARRDGETEWKTLGDFPEFSQFGITTGAGAVPPIGGAPQLPVAGMAGAATASVTGFDESELAGRWLRLGSSLLDSIFSMVAALPGMIMLGPAFFAAILAASRHQSPDFSAFAAGGMLLGVLLLCVGSLGFLAYQIWGLSTRGQTLAKRLLGIRVVRHPDGAPAGFVHGWLLRNLVPGVIRCLPWIGFLFFLVDCCFIFTPERRCLHDLIAGTKVVKA